MSNLNPYIPFSTGTAELEQAYLNDMKADRLRFEELTRIGNSFERISEQLDILHNIVNAPKKESEVTNVK